MALFTYAQNKLIDFVLRQQAWTPPSVAYVGLILATKGYHATSTAYSSGDTVMPIGGNGRLYKCTTGGTTAGSAPTWPTTPGGTVSDGGAVWTEQSLAIEQGTFDEVSTSGTNYARVRVPGAGSLSLSAGFSGTASSSDTLASAGTSGTTYNLAAITYGVPSANWGGAGGGVIFGYFIADALTAGNPYLWFALNTPKTVNNGDPAPAFATAALNVNFGYDA